MKNISWCILLAGAMLCPGLSYAADQSAAEAGDWDLLNVVIRQATESCKKSPPADMAIESSDKFCGCFANKFMPIYMLMHSAGIPDAQIEPQRQEAFKTCMQEALSTASPKSSEQK